MRYFEDMCDKSGFNDGEAMPDGAEVYRELYLRVLNPLLEAVGSKTRFVAFNRPGMHNYCMLAPVSVSAYKRAVHDMLIWSGDASLDDDDFVGLDAKGENVVAYLQCRDVDDWVEVKTRIRFDELNAFLAGPLFTASVEAIKLGKDLSGENALTLEEAVKVRDIVTEKHRAQQGSNVGAPGLKDARRTVRHALEWVLKDFKYSDIYKDYAEAEHFSDDMYEEMLQVLQRFSADDKGA